MYKQIIQKFGSIALIFCAVNCYSDSVLDVAWTIYKEAQGESYLGKQAVATVIYNRSINRHKTFSEIVRQPKQFSPWLSGETPKKYDNQYFQQCLDISKQMHEGKFTPIDNWDHFYNPKLCSPSWSKNLTNMRIIGNHLFGRMVE